MGPVHFLCLRIHAPYEFRAGTPYYADRLGCSIGETPEPEWAFHTTSGPLAHLWHYTFHRSGLLKRVRTWKFSPELTLRSPLKSRDDT